MVEKKPRVDTSTVRTNVEVYLPRDVLGVVMGYLDRETLCTSRLVSKTFYAGASTRVRSLTLESTSKGVPFHQYPHLEHVTVKHAYPQLRDEKKSLAELEPSLRDFATALSIKNEHFTPSIKPTRDYLSQAVLMPKLRLLEVKGNVKNGGALLACCTNLEAIKLEGCRVSVASAIAMMTHLTLLHIACILDGHAPSADSFWLELTTNLVGLQALSIPVPNRALPLVGTLTGLTGLTMHAQDAAAAYSIAPLTRLTRLKSLSIPWGMTESNLGIACSLGLGSLVNLELWAREGASADYGRLLAQQTALTQLSLGGWQLCKLRYLGFLHIELLQCLEFNSFASLGAEGFSVLSRATSLTRFSIGPRDAHPRLELSQVLSRLTRLRCLRLGAYQVDARNSLDFPLALSPLTALTELKIECHDLRDGFTGALLVLTGLRVLGLYECRLSADVLPKLGRLTNLSALRTYRCGIKSLAPVIKVLDPLRKARGLPPLDTSGM